MTSRQRFRASFRSLLSIETLEARALLAGNVTATVTRGTLVIRGDAEANAIIIGQSSAAGGYTITPIDGSATTVNSGNVPVNLNNIQRFDIKLGAGNDVLGIGNDVTFVSELLAALDTYLQEDEGAAAALMVDEESGDDNPENLEDDPSILTFLGGDDDEEDEGFDINDPDFTPQQLAQLPTRVKGTTKIDLGDGDDSLVYLLRSNGGVDIDLGKGNDSLLSMLSAVGEMTIETDPRKGEGMGNDLAVLVLTGVRGNLPIATGGMDDTVVILGSTADNLGIGTGAPTSGAQTDNDVVYLANVSTADHMGIQTEGGDDGVYLDTIVADQFRISTGAGDDEVELIGAALVSLAIDTSSGDDWVSLSAGEEGTAPLAIRRNLVINTGIDDDQVEIDGGLMGLLVGNLLDIRTGSGDDGLLLYRASARNAFIDLESGNDNAVVDSFDVRTELQLNLGAGNDVLSAHNWTGKVLKARGGTGNDTLHDLGNHHEALDKSQFEVEDDDLI